MERAEEKLRSASLLFENSMFADAISEAYYSMFQHFLSPKEPVLRKGFFFRKRRRAKKEALLNEYRVIATCRNNA